MHTTTRVARAQVGLAGLVLLALPLLGRDATANEADFDSTLQRVHALMKVGRWSTAKGLLADALEEHAGEDYVLRRLGEVREDLERCSFGMHYTPPEPDTVVAAEIVAYRPARGEIHLRYEAQRESGRAGAVYSTFLRPGDFAEQERGEVWVHPLAWNGPHTIRVRGRSLPSSDVLGIVPCSSPDEGWSVTLNSSAGAIYRMSEDTAERVSDVVPVTTNGPYELEIRVESTEIRVSLDGRRILRASKPRQLYGPIGFTQFGDIEEISLEGRGELSWIQRKVDAENELARIEFEKDYDVADDLPAWLREYESAEDSGTEPSAFGGFGSDAEIVLSRAETFDAKNDHEGGLAFARALSADEAPPAVRAWLECHFLASLGRHADALPLARETTRLAPGFFAGRRKHVELLHKTGAKQDWEREARALLGAFPEQPEAYEDLAQARLLEGDRAGARAVLASALERQVRSRKLQLVDELLARAAKGPTWQRSHSYSSNHYEIHSDISREICLEAARVLDTAYRRFSMRLGRIEGDGQQRFPVYLFSGEAGYLMYSADLLGYLPVHTAGVYSPALQQLLVWNLPEREQMLATIRHEGFHQYLDQLVGAAPTWLHEGLAEYFELSRFERGQWVDGLASPVHLAQLRGSGFEWTPLEEFLRIEPDEFYRDAPVHYAQAWLWVHYLENSGVQNKRRLTTLVDALREGRGVPAALERAFPAQSLPTLERAWRKHLDSL